MTSDLKDKELVFWTKSPNKFFVAKSKESGRILGCASFKEMTLAKVELCRVAVNKEFRGLKIGENLLKFMIDLAKESGYNTMYLETSEAQKAANKLYEKHGFKSVHSVPMNVFGFNVEHLCGFKEKALIKNIISGPSKLSNIVDPSSQPQG